MAIETVENRRQEGKNELRPAYRPMNELDRARILGIAIWAGTALITIALLMYLVINPW